MGTQATLAFQVTPAFLVLVVILVFLVLVVLAGTPVYRAIVVIPV